MSISVVIPAFNAAETLDEALASVAAQDWPDWETLVVDDGSADATREVALARTRRDPRMRLLGLDRNGGVAAARNHALVHASGDVVAFLDADDAYLPHAIGTLAAALAGAPGADLAYGMAETMEGSGVHRLGRGRPGAPVGIFGQLARFNVMATSAVAVRRAALERAPFPVGLPFQFEDWACWLELARRRAFLFVPAVVTRYRCGPAGATARVRASGREAELAAAMGRHLRARSRGYSPPEQAAVRAGLAFRATEALLAALHHARRARAAAAVAWLRAAVTIAGSPAVLVRAAAAVGAGRRRARRGLDPPLTLLPPPSPGEAP